MDIERHDKILNIVQENVEEVQERTRKRLRSKLPEQNLQVGDVVLRRNIRSQQQKGGKLDPEFLGPFTVSKIDGKSIDLVVSNGKSIWKSAVTSTPPTTFTSGQPTVTSTPPATVTSVQHAVTSIPSAVISSPTATVNPIRPAVASSPPAVTSAPGGISSPPAGIPFAPTALAFSGKYLKDAWAGKNVHVLLSKMGPYKMFYWDIAKLAPNQQLKVINAYLMHIVKKSNQQQRSKQALCIDSFEMSNIWQGKTTKLKYAEKILSGEPLTFSSSASAVLKYRQEVAMTLIEETDDLKELCHYCGERNNGKSKRGKRRKRQECSTVWIQCDNCTRWYHITCVANPNLKEPYSCLACEQG
ncbi:uncharacterized protein LOC125798996 [Astyanax mexicanus]|uniref:uncharacterized protein LOC125798996 n=1 Tax=Astyanax mexicanus TaxID=7994 RepID=UPI0020CAB2E6|nr:uncharacterized protein LOC125798996 [Astyanax mexicanus]